MKNLQWTRISPNLKTLEHHIKDQGTYGGRPQGVKQDRTCTRNVKKGRSSIPKVMKDILSTRILRLLNLIKDILIFATLHLNKIGYYIYFTDINDIFPVFKCLKNIQIKILIIKKIYTDLLIYAEN